MNAYVNFIWQNLEIVMICAGIFVLGALMLLMYLEKKHYNAKKLENEKLEAQKVLDEQSQQEQTDNAEQEELSTNAQMQEKWEQIDNSEQEELGLQLNAQNAPINEEEFDEDAFLQALLENEQSQENEQAVFENKEQQEGLTEDEASVVEGNVDSSAIENEEQNQEQTAIFEQEKDVQDAEQNAIIEPKTYEQNQFSINAQTQDKVIEQTSDIEKAVDIASVHDAAIKDTVQNVDTQVEDKNIFAEIDEEALLQEQIRQKEQELALLLERAKNSASSAQEKVQIVAQNKNIEKPSSEVKKEVKEDKKEAILASYEDVIKESDQMLEAMQSIIDDNIQEMEKIKTADDNSKINSIDTQKQRLSIVSKYKVMYDKVKKDWVVKKEGSTRAAKRCSTKEEAIEFAKKCTIDSEFGTTFHKKDGRFQKRVNN